MSAEIPAGPPAGPGSTPASSHTPQRRMQGRYLLLAVLALFAAVTIQNPRRLALAHASGQKHLRFVHTYTTESERAIIDDAVAEFRRIHPDFQVDQIVFNSETYQMVGWRLQFQGQRQSDLLFTWQGHKSRTAIDHGWVLNIEPYLSPGFVDSLVPSLMGRGSQGHGIYLLPQSVDLSNLVWYDKAWFQREGYKVPATLEEWTELNLKIRSSGKLPLVQGNRDLWPVGNLAAELIGKRGGPQALDRVVGGSDPVPVEALEGLRPLHTLARGRAFDAPGILGEGALRSLTDIEAKVMFLTGKAPQHVIGSWFLADIRDARANGELKLEPGVFAVPAAQGSKQVMTAVVTGFQVNSRTQHPRECVQLLEILLSRPFQERFAALGNLSARQDARSFTQDPLALELLDALGSMNQAVPPPDTGYPIESATVFYELCGRVAAGELDLERFAQLWNEERRRFAIKGQE